MAKESPETSLGRYPAEALPEHTWNITWMKVVISMEGGHITKV